MTATASTASPVPATADVRPVDTTARGALLLQLSFALLWLLAGGTFALVHSIQLHTPLFFADFSWFTFGRVQAVMETSLLYGWVANAGFAASLWLLGRLGGAPARGVGLTVVATVFWNIGVALAVILLIAGNLTGNALVQLPLGSLPLLLISSAIAAASAVYAWADRRTRETYATQWYAALATFVLPWFLSVALTMLALAPDNGVAETVAATWTGQGLLLLWLAPLALAALYYLYPKATGRDVPYYSLAKAGFWLLVVFGPWAGTRELVGGPFPAWIPALGVAASIVLLVHYAIIAVNLGPVMGQLFGRSNALRFGALSVFFYLVLGVAGLVCSLFPLVPWLQFTYVSEARTLLMILGVFAPAMFAATYFLVPRATGKAWAAQGLITQHFRFWALGVLLIAVGFVGAGFQQSTLFFAPNIQFTQIDPTLKVWLLLTSAGLGLQLIGTVFLLVNLGYQIAPGTSTPEGGNS